MSGRRVRWKLWTLIITSAVAASLGGMSALQSCQSRVGEPTALVGSPLDTVWGRADASDRSLVAAVDRWMSKYPKANWFLSDFGAMGPDRMLVTVPADPATTTQPRPQRRVAMFVIENGQWREPAEFAVDGVPDYALASSTVLPTRSSAGAAAYRLEGNQVEELEVPTGLWRLSVSERGQWVGFGPSGVHFGSIEENRLVSVFRADAPADLLNNASNVGVAWLHDDLIAVFGSMYVVDLRAGWMRQASEPDGPGLSVTPCRGRALDDRSIVTHDRTGVAFVVGIDAGGVVTSVHEFGLPVEQVLLEVDSTGEWAVTMTLERLQPRFSARTARVRLRQGR